MAENFGLVSKSMSPKLGRRSYFTPEGKVLSQGNGTPVIENGQKNPVIWIIALSNFFVYIIRFTILDWGSSILTQFKGLDITLTASVVEAILLATLWKQPATAYGRLEKITAECRKENP